MSEEESNTLSSLPAEMFKRLAGLPWPFTTLWLGLWGVSKWLVVREAGGGGFSLQGFSIVLTLEPGQAELLLIRAAWLVCQILLHVPLAVNVFGWCALIALYFLFWGAPLATETTWSSLLWQLGNGASLTSELSVMIREQPSVFSTGSTKDLTWTRTLDGHYSHSLQAVLWGQREAWLPPPSLPSASLEGGNLIILMRYRQSTSIMAFWHSEISAHRTAYRSLSTCVFGIIWRDGGSQRQRRPIRWLSWGLWVRNPGCGFAMAVGGGSWYQEWRGCFLLY